MRILNHRTLSEVKPGNPETTPECSPPPRRCDYSVSLSHIDVKDAVVPKVPSIPSAETLVFLGKLANYRANRSVNNRISTIRSPIKNTLIVEVPATFNAKLCMSSR